MIKEELHVYVRVRNRLKDSSSYEWVYKPHESGFTALYKKDGRRREFHCLFLENDKVEVCVYGMHMLERNLFKKYIHELNVLYDVFSNPNKQIIDIFCENDWLIDFNMGILHKDSSLSLIHSDLTDKVFKKYIGNVYIVTDDLQSSKLFFNCDVRKRLEKLGIFEDVRYDWPRSVGFINNFTATSFLRLFKRFKYLFDTEKMLNTKLNLIAEEFIRTGKVAQRIPMK